MPAVTKVTVTSVSFGGNSYSRSGNKLWVQVWGWWPTGDSPRYGWSEVPLDKAPAEVLEALGFSTSGT